MGSSLNDPQSPVQLGALVRAGAVFALLCGFASGFVYLRNLQVERGKEVGRLEDRIAALQGEIEAVEIRLAQAKTRDALLERVASGELSLSPIPPGALRRIEGRAVEKLPERGTLPP